MARFRLLGRRSDGGDERRQTYACPVCGYLKLTAKPYAQWPPTPGVELHPPYAEQLGRPSHQACPQCGFRFGDTDGPEDGGPQSFDEHWREWHAHGRRPADPAVEPPRYEPRWLIRRRPEPGSAYEGFERPGLGEEVPADVRAQAQALEDARAPLALRRVVAQLARDGIGGYDVVLVDAGGPGWEPLGMDFLIDGRSALLHREEARDPYWRTRLNAHGLLEDVEDIRWFTVAVSPDEVVSVSRLRRSALEPGDHLWYTIGNEYSPNDHAGRIVLTLQDDGAATLEHVSRAGEGVWTGRVDSAVVARIRAELGRSPFPDLPREPIPPGAAIATLEAMTDGDLQWATTYIHQALRYEGYKEALELLEAIAGRLSEGAYPRGPDTLDDAAVTDVRQVAKRSG